MMKFTFLLKRFHGGRENRTHDQLLKSFRRRNIWRHYYCISVGLLCRKRLSNQSPTQTRPSTIIITLYLYVCDHRANGHLLSIYLVFPLWRNYLVQPTTKPTQPKQTNPTNQPTTQPYIYVYTYAVPFSAPHTIFAERISSIISIARHLPKLSTTWYLVHGYVSISGHLQAERCFCNPSKRSVITPVSCGQLQQHSTHKKHVQYKYFVL